MSSRNSLNRPKSLNRLNKVGFSLVELLIVIVIVGVLGVVSFVAVQRTKMRTMNEKMLDDLVAIANALEDYRRDHQGLFPIPTSEDNQNVLCFYSDATYADCEDDNRSFIQGMIDNSLLTKRYLREVPTDPRTGSRYVYGVSKDGKFYQVAGIYEVDSGSFEARTVENLAKGFQLPSLIRAYDGPNFVIDRETNLPYPSDHLALTGTLDNVQGTVTVDGDIAVNQMVVREGQIISTEGGGEVDIYFSDGSVTHIDPISVLDLKSLRTDKNDKTGTITKILMNLTKGKIWNKVARLASASEFRVETTGAIAGVRGTEFGVDKDGNVTLKKGRVWRKTRAELNLTANATANEILAKPAPVNEGDPSFVPIDPDTTKYEKYYEIIPLTENNQPHILSIAPSSVSGLVTVTVRNVNFFANMTNSRLNITEPEQMHRVQANRLAVYQPIDPTNALTRFPYQLLTSPKPLNIAEEQAGPYTIDIPVGSVNSLFLRFEYVVDGKVVRASALAPIPPLREGIVMNERSIYPNLVPLETGFALRAPDLVSYRTGIIDPQSFPVGIVCPSESIPSVSVGPTSVCAYSVSDPDTVQNCPAMEMSIQIAGIGDCTITATVTKTDGTTETQTKMVKVVEATTQLNLLRPVIEPGTTTGKWKATFNWLAGNLPTNVDYRFSLSYQSIEGGDWIMLPPTYEDYPTNQFPVKDNLDPGNYQWYVTIRGYDSSNNYIGDIETKLATFTISSVPSANFGVSTNDPLATVATGGVSGEVIVTTSAASLNLDLVADQPDHLDDYTYQWSGATITDTTKPYEATVTFVDLPLGVPINNTVTLSIRKKIDGLRLGDLVSNDTKAVTVTRQSVIQGISFFKGSDAVDQDSLYVSDWASVSPLNISGGYRVGVIRWDNYVQSPTGPMISCAFSLAPPPTNSAGGILTAEGPDTLYTPSHFGSMKIQCAPAVPVGYRLDSHSQKATITVKIQRCGYGALQGPEVCDPPGSKKVPASECGLAALYSKTCTSECQWGACDLEGGATCGNDQAEGDEPCDGGDLRGETCASRKGAGWTGTLTCTSCAFNDADCVAQPVAPQFDLPGGLYHAKGSELTVATLPATLPVGYAMNLFSKPAADTNDNALTSGHLLNMTQEGVYRLEIKDSGGTRVDSVDVRVCGYVGDGSQCWTLGKDLQPCFANSGSSACGDIGLICAGGDWNDCGANGTCDTSFVANSDDFSACVSLAQGRTPSVTVNDTNTNRQTLSSTAPTNSFAPYLRPTLSACYKRYSGPTPPALPPLNCTQTPLAGYSRVCRCQ